MGEIHKFTKDGVTLFPATTTDAVVHPQIRSSISDLIYEYNVTVLYPNSGSYGTSKYTLQGAISLLYSKLEDSQKIPGIKIVFDLKDSDETQEWRYNGGLFTSVSSWSRQDSWYADNVEGIADLDNNILNDALRKSEQNLTENERSQVKKNLAVELDAYSITWGVNSDINNLITTGIYTISGYRSNETDNLPINEINVNISGILKVIKSPKNIAQYLVLVGNESISKSFSRVYNFLTDTWGNWNILDQTKNLGTINLFDFNRIIEPGEYRAVIRDQYMGATNQDIKFYIYRNGSNISQLVYLPNSTPLYRYIKGNTWSEFEKLVTEDEIRKLQNTISNLQVAVNELQLKTSEDYCVASWDPNDLKPECDEVFGKLSFCDDWDFYLIDTTTLPDENGVIKPVGKLKRNNLLRFEDGSWAPTVGITESRKSECSDSLYFDKLKESKYCDAGKFNSKNFYDEYGVNTDLYNSEGNKVNILRPWETTETKYTIGISRNDTIYFLDNVIGESGKIWKGIFSKPIAWDGIDVSKYELKTTAISPGPCTLITENSTPKSRNFFYTYPGQSSCKGVTGKDTGCEMFYNHNRAYPVSYDTNTSGYRATQINSMKWARNNNSNVKSPVPIAEGSIFALNAFITSYEIFYGTKNLHDENKFTGGICSITCNNEDSWLKYGGIRVRDVKDTEWYYAAWGDPTRIYDYYSIYHRTTSDKNADETTWSDVVNYSSPKEACMESQMAASYAIETGINENTEFEFYGSIYWYKNVPNTTGNEKGLNVIVYKKIESTIDLYTGLENKPFTVKIEAILRVGLLNGVNLGGDSSIYYGGGFELVGTNDITVNPEHSPSMGGYPINIYLETEQSKWLYEERYQKQINFDFEQYYPLLARSINLDGRGYSIERIPFTIISTKKGGTNSSGECSYYWSGNNWSYEAVEANTFNRICCICRYHSVNESLGYRSARYSHLSNGTQHYYSTSMQTRINTEKY